jgi:hypothetical protein
MTYKTYSIYAQSFKKMQMQMHQNPLPMLV